MSLYCISISIYIYIWLEIGSDHQLGQVDRFPRGFRTGDSESGPTVRQPNLGRLRERAVVKT